MCFPSFTKALAFFLWLFIDSSHQSGTVRSGGAPNSPLWLRRWSGVFLLHPEETLHHCRQCTVPFLASGFLWLYLLLPSVLPIFVVVAKHVLTVFAVSPGTAPGQPFFWLLPLHVAWLPGFPSWLARMLLLLLYGPSPVCDLGYQICSAFVSSAAFAWDWNIIGITSAKSFNKFTSQKILEAQGELVVQFLISINCSLLLLKVSL